MNVSAQASLIAAAMDLQVVRLLRDAIRTADLSSAKQAGTAGIGPEPRFEPRPVVHPTPRFEPRPVVHPEPRFEPRRVIHPVELRSQPPVAPPAEPEKPRITPSPIQPPWRALPWKDTPPQPVQKLKVVIKPPDLPKKGSVFDVFI